METSTSNKRTTKKRKTEKKQEEIVAVATIEPEPEPIVASSTVNVKHSKLAKKDQMLIDTKMLYGAGLMQILLTQLRFSPNSELELHIGTHTDGVFHSGVSQEFFDHFMQLLHKSLMQSEGSEYKSVDFEDKWNYSMVYYYDEKVRGIQLLKNDAKTKEGPSLYERGGRLCKIDFIQKVESSGLYDLRFNLKREQKLTATEIDEFFSHQPKLQSVRLKAQQSYEFPKLGYKIDLSKVWLGNSEDQAIKLKAGLIDNEKLCTREIELEIVDSNGADANVYFQQCIHMLGQGALGVLHLSPVIELPQKE
jgi:hypothetical protein